MNKFNISSLLYSLGIGLFISMMSIDADAKVSNASHSSNPVLPEYHADPEILFSEQTGKYYIYSTTDGTPGWGGHYFKVFSSNNLADWKDNGIVLDLKGPQVAWSTGNAWAPAIIERKYDDGTYKYFLYASIYFSVPRIPYHSSLPSPKQA